MSLYPDHVSRRFREPRFAGRPERGDRVGTATTPAAHAQLRMHWRLDADQRVVDAGFAARGCPWLIATADWLAETSIGECLPELCARMTVEDIVSALEIPALKRYCAVMARQALIHAGEIND